MLCTHKVKRIAVFVSIMVIVLIYLNTSPITTQFAATQTPLQYPEKSLTDFSSSHFSGSGKCALCHSALTDSAGNDVSIDADWRLTMMANSSKDPFWQAKVSSEVARNRALSAVIEDKCATCHTPMADAGNF